MSEKKEKSKEANRRRHLFLLTLFPDQERNYKSIELNGYILVRQWNGGSGHWEVAIHTPQTWKKIKEYQSSMGTPNPLFPEDFGSNGKA